MKKIRVVGTIAIVVSVLDSLGMILDLEPTEPGYETFGGIGALGNLLTFPVILLRSTLGRWLGGSDSIQYTNETLYIWVADPLIVMACAILFFGIRRLWRKVRMIKTTPQPA